ncbi:hypothetical protein K8R62_00240 [bacterium]|nr:hypothetical protein [bacterium]
MSFIPNEPYIFQSGKNQGKAVSQVAINNFPLLKHMYRRINETGSSKKNRLHVQLEWLMKRIAKTKPKMICPVCKRNPVKLISVLGNDRYGYSISEGFVCCEDKKCRERLEGLALGRNNRFIIADFSSVSIFRNKTDQRRMINLLKKIYGLEGKLTKERAFNFFLEG